MNQKKKQLKEKVSFIEDQLESLDRYLPETYDYLMAELDVQRCLLAEIEVSEMFEQIDSIQVELQSSGHDCGGSETSRKTSKLLHEMSQQP